MDTQNNKMPALFIGHGSPMNAIEKNEFTCVWNRLGETMPRPKLILCISAHWETRGSFLTAMKNPRTIHDFGGFPKELYSVQYPAPGFPEFAEEIKDHSPTLNITLDKQEWGFDHGSWSVVKHLYPLADIPMIQLSIDHFMSFEEHYKFAKTLSYLREKEVLIVGSGNIVHNLRAIDWHNTQNGYDWAIEVRHQVNEWITNNNTQKLLDINKMGGKYKIAIPTTEHYIPLLYTLALQRDDDKLSFFNDELVMGSLSMTGVMIQ